MNAPIVSRGPMGLAAAILAGCASVGVMLAGLLYKDGQLAFLACFTALPLYLAGLGAGSLAGLVATVTGTVALALMQPAGLVVAYLLAFGIPAVTLIRMALRYRIGGDQVAYWYPEGNLLTLVTFYPCVLFIIASIIAAPHAGGLLSLTSETFNQHATDFAAQFPEDQPEAFHKAVAMISGIMPAFLSYFWILVAMMSIVGAQYVLRQRKLNLRDVFSFQQLRLPRKLVYVFAACGLAGTLAPQPYDYTARNLSMILGLPFFFVGLAVLHTLVAHVRASWILLIIFYAIMALMPLITLIVAGLGVVDQWVDFRQRIANKTTAQLK